MYSREERMKAIELYIKYDKSIAAVIHELGYPSRGLLPRWYKAYLKEQETGVLWERYSRCSKYSVEKGGCDCAVHPNQQRERYGKRIWCHPGGTI